MNEFDIRSYYLNIMSSQGEHYIWKIENTTKSSKQNDTYLISYQAPLQTRRH